MIEIMTEVGRMVGGHPMVSRKVMDEKTKLQRICRDGVTPMIDFYVAIAIAKGQETHWNQTVWGQQIYNEAVAAFPNGEHGTLAFSWKVTDGDSQIPNKKMKKPCDREGYPGHWVLHCSNGFAIPCFHRGRYDPTQQIQRKEEIKGGDYIRLNIRVKGNGAVAPNTPGVYLNPESFELYQAGVEIVGESAVDAQGTFGADAGALPAGAMVDPNVPAAGGMAPPPQGGMAPPPQGGAPGTAPPAPATDILTPPPPPADFNVNVDGTIHLASALKAANWTEAQINGYPRA